MVGSTRLAGKVVGITGAAGGLGRATAFAMAREGAKLAVTDIDADGVAALVGELEALGYEPVSVCGDVTDATTHRLLATAAQERFGKLNGWVNVAGVLGPGTIEEASQETFDRVMHVNCFAQLLAVQQALPHLRASGNAAIVNVSSIGGLRALPLMTTYCASKAAVIGLTRALAAELSPNIRCNVVCPGGIDTGMSRHLLEGLTPEEQTILISKLTGRQLLKRFALPEEIAPTLVHLISDESAFTTGAIISVDGGHACW